MSAIYHLWFLFILAYYPSYTKLASPIFAEREIGSATIDRNWPLTAPIIIHGLSSTDSEVIKRCNSAIPYYKTTIDSYLYAVKVVLHQSEHEDLPWADDKVVRTIVHSCPNISQGLAEFARVHRLINDNEVCILTPTFDSQIWAANHLRFRYRKIPTSFKTTWKNETIIAMMLEWSMIQGSK